MPSADSMPVKTGQVQEQDDDNRSLGSMLKGRKSAAAAAKESRVKKEVPADGNVDSSCLSKAGSSSPSVGGTNKVKKQDDDDDNVPISVKVSSAAKNVKESTKKTKTKQEEVKEKQKAATKSADQPEKKRERKVYDLPGQKRDPPAEREPLRIFYETLYNQIPSSEMAQIWMMESGLLEKEEAKRIFAKKQKGNQIQKLSSSPAKLVGYNSVQRGLQNTVKKKVSTPVSSSQNNKKKITTTEEGKVVSSKKQKHRNNKDDGSSDESDDDFVLAAKVTKKPKKQQQLRQED